MAKTMSAPFCITGGTERYVITEYVPPYITRNAFPRTYAAMRECGYDGSWARGHKPQGNKLQLFWRTIDGQWSKNGPSY
jgi:hypothetical protein